VGWTHPAQNRVQRRVLAKTRVVALMMETVSTFETSVYFYETTRRNIPEDSLLHTRRRENLKSHLIREIISGFVQCHYLCSHIEKLNKRTGEVCQITENTLGQYVCPTGVHFSMINSFNSCFDAVIYNYFNTNTFSKRLREIIIIVSWNLVTKVEFGGLFYF
jgi:hypothetical protein